MVALDKEELDRFFDARREEHRKNRRQMEKQVGIVLLVCSLFMAILFLGALKFSLGQAGFMAVPIFFLIVSVALFARGLWDLLYGRHKKTGRR